MSENVTIETVVDEASEILGEVDDYSETDAFRKIIRQTETFLLPSLIVIGVPCNVLALVVLIRRRLWLQHEAYVYLAAILILNVTTLTLVVGDVCLFLFDGRLVRLSTSADIMCKLWFWLTIMISHTEWLHIMLLLNIYLRQQRTINASNDRRMGLFCANLAAKYCSLFATKVITCSFFTVCALLNFWAFMVFRLERHGDIWFCTPSGRRFRYYHLLYTVPLWIDFLSRIIVILLLVLVIWKFKRSSGFTFSQMDDASENIVESEVTARLIVCCEAVFVLLVLPFFLTNFVYIVNVGLDFYHKINKARLALRLIYFTHFLATPIVCFAVKSRFRDDLKALLQRCCHRCCPGSRRNRTVPVDSGNNDVSVLQLNIIEEDSHVPRREED